MNMFGLECWLIWCTSFDWFCFWIILAIKVSSSEEGDPATTSIYSHFDFTSNLTAVFCDDGKCGCRGQLWRWEGNWWYAVPSNHVFKCWFLILSTMTMWNLWTCQWKNISLFQVCLTDITECAMLERPCVTPVGASLPPRRWFFWNRKSASTQVDQACEQLLRFRNLLSAIKISSSSPLSGLTVSNNIF